MCTQGTFASPHMHPEAGAWAPAEQDWEQGESALLGGVWVALRMGARGCEGIAQV